MTHYTDCVKAIVDCIGNCFSWMLLTQSQLLQDFCAENSVTPPNAFSQAADLYLRNMAN